ncbi:GNAT family N-acetyltransferase [Pontibacillus salicampi]|uniref:GNAT family N-acetyltransferase n=1 Tax=Pontibacillus salicampi TaxID=1449801 RepID=A0ABV6LKW9_9BACI
MEADPSEKAIMHYLQKGVGYVAKEGEDVVGVYVLLPTRPYTIELVNIAVASFYRGKGIGKKLVSHAISISREEGYHTMEVGTGNSSAEPLMLYQKCGFRIKGVDIDYFPKHYEEKIVENGIECRDMIRLSRELK